MRRFRQAKQLGLTHGTVRHRELKPAAESTRQVSDRQRARMVEQHRVEFAVTYRIRLRSLIVASRKLGSEPVLTTQPALFGPAIDDITKTNLGQMKVFEVNGQTQWDILEQYNQVTREVAEEFNVLLIDLATEMPKSSEYFYDYYHFTNAGAEQVSNFIYRKLKPLLPQRYPEYLLVP